MLNSLTEDQKKNVTLIACPVEREPYKGENKDDYYYRKHPVIKLTCVPSLLLFEGEKNIHRLVDVDECANEQVLQKFKNMI